MDELLKAITGLISTGGDLAGDALYLYFALRIIEPLSGTIALLGSIKIITNTILKFRKDPK